MSGISGTDELTLPSRSPCTEPCQIQRGFAQVVESLKNLDTPTNLPGYQDSMGGLMVVNADGNVGIMPEIAVQWPALGNVLLGGGPGPDAGAVQVPGAAGELNFNAVDDSDLDGLGLQIPGAWLWPNKGIIWWLQWADDDDPPVLVAPLPAQPFNKQPLQGPNGGALWWIDMKLVPDDAKGTTDYEDMTGLDWTLDWTIIIWCRPESTTPGTIMVCYDPALDKLWRLFIEEASFEGAPPNAYGASVEIQGVGGGVTIDQVGTWSLNKWMIVIIRYDSASNTLEVITCPVDEIWDDRASTSVVVAGGLTGAWGTKVRLLADIDSFGAWDCFIGQIAWYHWAQDYYHDEQLEWMFNNGYGQQI